MPDERTVPEIAAQVGQRWRRDAEAKRFVLIRPPGWRARLSQLLPLDRTEVLDLYRWSNAHEGTSQGMAEQQALARDHSTGYPGAPRRMWFTNGWGISESDARYLKSSYLPPRNHILLQSSDQDAEIVVHVSRWTRREKLLASAFAALSATGSLASIISLIRG